VDDSDTRGIGWLDHNPSPTAWGSSRALDVPTQFAEKPFPAPSHSHLRAPTPIWL
jgi:hypothetical protein